VTVATIKDVAARAGVGIGTVSRVINDHPSVTADTRARVQAAIATLDYHPSRVARALSRQRSNSIAMVVPYFTHTSLMERVRGILTALADSPYELVVFNGDHESRRRERFAQSTRRDLADGLLVVSMAPTAEETARILAGRIPTVVIDAATDNFPSYCVDDVLGGRMAAAHLLALGHRRIGYIGDEDTGFGFTSTPLRRVGLVTELTNAGLALDADFDRVGSHGRAVARSLATEMLDRPDRPTAIFAHSDTQAIGVLEAARALGLRVPDDLSVLGFDDIEAAELVGLTTVRQPLFDSGRRAARRLLDLLEDGTVGDRDKTLLPLDIVRRSTTGPAPTTRRTPTRPTTQTTKKSATRSTKEDHR
jgi:DNA-binding LacI/PurR family transcriptional regulator